MATFKHPETGVILNEISVRRGTLNFDEAVLAWFMRFQAIPYHTIAYHLGVNAFELGKVYRGEQHQNAKPEAVRKFLAAQLAAPYTRRHGQTRRRGTENHPPRPTDQTGSTQGKLDLG
ncbi:MAG: hypothetical protein GYB53_22190 [Rhodobacteraceae bacterium]|nr:hypothetical protein [Paracoccaceae bacterium]MBR9823715.1 hypothetical protein [Paracoccaceae bacterium]